MNTKENDSTMERQAILCHAICCLVPFPKNMGNANVFPFLHHSVTDEDQMSTIVGRRDTFSHHLDCILLIELNHNLGEAFREHQFDTKNNGFSSWTGRISSTPNN